MERYQVVGHLRLDPEGTVTSYADAQATVEALQRVRDEFERERDQLHAALVEAALLCDHNLRRCDVLDSKYKKGLAAVKVLQSQLSQLQALVRALVGTKSFTINGPDIRTMSGNVLYACSSQTSAERLGALLEYRERTLDATTPATHEQDKATVFNEWDGALRKMADVEPKGGDGE